MNRKLLILTGCLFLLGTLARAQAPVAQFTSNVTSGCAPLGVRFIDQSANNPTSWEWSFGNGQTSSQPSPTVAFGTPGIYDVTLIVKNASGADAIRKTGYITVYASPDVSFGLDRTLACSPATIQFLQFSTPGQGSIINYLWNFGDGTNGNGPTPTHLYTQTGYYTVTLTATNSGGCSNSSTLTRVLRLVDGVQPNFTWSEVGGACTAPYTLNFLNQTAGPGNMTYNWSLGTGAAPATSTALNPAGISYPAAGSYTVTLAAQSDLGCSDTLTQTIALASTTPVINAPGAGCINSPVNFSNGTSPAPISSSWNFGDGATSNQPTTTHTYSASGPYTVTLTNNYANCTTTASSTINIGSALVPAFTAVPTTACQAPLTVQFTDQTSPTPTLWTWDFGDGTPLLSGQQNPVHTYATTGIFDVTLTATTAAGCSGSTKLTKEINIVAPTITMTGQGACIGQVFTPSYTVNTVDTVVSYAWNAPGATPSAATGPNPGFTYPSTGFYSLTLTITTKSGCTATQTFTNAVQVGTPTPASFTYSPLSPICGKNVVTFTSPSTPANQWYWTFNDGSATDSGQTVNHEFRRTGTMVVVLAVNHDGCVTQTTQPVTVSPPIPNFGWVVNCVTNNPGVSNPLNVSFQDSTLRDTTLAPLTYDWNFGDGSPDFIDSTSPWSAPSHTYPGVDSFTVTLTVTNGACSSTATKTLYIQSVTAQFTAAPNPVCIQQPFTLTSTTITNPFGTGRTGYIWNISPTEHDHASGVFSSHLSTPGSYPITLTVTDLNGCQYTSNPVTLTVTAPTVKFTAQPGGCVNGTITFTDNSTPSALGSANTQYIWNFGDGTGGHNFSAPPFTYQYADTGSYTVIETVVDNAGCGARDTVTNAVQITSPHAQFIEPDSFYCPGTPVTFTDLSTGYSLTEQWDFGDATGTQTSPTHSFPPASGLTYVVKLTITDKYGCVTDTVENIKIVSPTAAFTIADTTGICVPLQTMFTAAGTYYDSLYWEFGDGQTSTLAPGTSHFYNKLGTYIATLVVQGPGGCRDSTSRNVYLINPNTSTFDFTPKTACDSVVAQFTILPPPYTTFQVNFGDNSMDSSGNLALIHTYRSPNTFVPLLYLTDATGCIVTLHDTLLTVLGAVPFYTAAPVVFCDTGTVAFIDYTITNNGVLTKTFDWGDGTLPSSESPPQTAPFNTTHDFTVPGIHPVTLTVVTLANCTASYTDTIHVYQTPQAIIADSGYLCAGLVPFLGKLAVPDADTIFWQWDFGNGQTSNMQNPPVQAAAGIYNIRLKASVAIGCSDTTSATVTVNPNPTIKGPKQISTPVSVPVTIPFTYSPDVTTWAWTPAVNLSCVDCPNPSATLTFAQTYSVLVTDSNHCTDTASILITTVCNEGNYFVPNTFSPNGDGVNDYFYPRGSGLYNIQSMTVFNRWGQVVFQRKNFPANAENMGWDGTFNGKPAPMDAYVYIIEVICNNAQIIPLHGNVTLIR